MKELERAARTSCALDLLTTGAKRGVMAYYCEGDAYPAHVAPSACRGGCEDKNAMAMKIMNYDGPAHPRVECRRVC